MSSERVEIPSIPTGVPKFDEVLAGGIPELSFTILAGGPGSGKTTLAHQIMFATASPERPALYVTILGEPPLKMLRYQQQYAFFDPAKLADGSITYLHLGGDLVLHGLETVLSKIVHEVSETSPKLVFVDSFRSIVRRSSEPGQMELQSFVQRLSLHLTGWEATTFLIGEYEDREAESNPIFTVADGIVWLSQERSRNSIVRKVQVLKMRGRGSIPGLHTMRISSAGLQIYPRMPSPAHSGRALEREPRRKTGIGELDEMLGGGLPAGYSVMVVGPSGSGKTVLSTQFIREGVEHGEHGVIAVFEKQPDEYLMQATGGAALAELVKSGQLKMLYLRPLDLSVDETMEAISLAVHEVGATRVVIDSLMGFELALAPSFREDFRESLYRLVGALTALGVTVLMTAELVDSYTELRLSPHEISFLTDAIILQRYVELEGRLRKVMVVAKMRGFAHSDELRLYDVGTDGIEVGEPVHAHAGILVGAPRRLP